MFVCLFVCLFVRSLVRSFVRSSVRRVRVVGGGCARLLSTVLQPIEMLANGPPWMIAKLFSIVCARAGDQTNKQTNEQASKQATILRQPSEQRFAARTRRVESKHGGEQTGRSQPLDRPASRNFQTLPETLKRFQKRPETDFLALPGTTDRSVARGIDRAWTKLGLIASFRSA